MTVLANPNNCLCSSTEAAPPPLADSPGGHQPARDWGLASRQQTSQVLDAAPGEGGVSSLPLFCFSNLLPLQGPQTGPLLTLTSRKSQSFPKSRAHRVRVAGTVFLSGLQLASWTNYGANGYSPPCSRLFSQVDSCCLPEGLRLSFVLPSCLTYDNFL